MSRFCYNGVYLSDLGVNVAQVANCPFCKSTINALTLERGGYVMCQGCGANGPETDWKFKYGPVEVLPEALRAWNRCRE